MLNMPGTLGAHLPDQEGGFGFAMTYLAISQPRGSSSITLINAQNNPKYTHIKRTTKGIAFFATPHKGGSNILVGIGGVLAKIALELGFQKGDNLIETLREDSVFSNTMHDLWRQQSLEYDIVSFWGSSDKVVPRESARFGLPGDRENAVTLNADHRTVCKFGEQETDLDNLKLVCANLKDLYWHALEDYSSKSDSFTTLNCDPSLDKQLPLWLFDPQAEESQKQREEYLRCDACHDKSDEFLLGVSNTSIFHTWASRSGSSLWCQNPESNAASDHANIAACVMKHTLALNGPPVDENSTKRLPSQVLYYKCTTTSPGLVPEEYGDQLEDSELQTNFQRTVDETESQMFAPELMLRAFIAQICGRDQSALLAEYHKGPESPETAFQTLKRIFAALLCQKNGRLFLVVDELHLPQFRIADIVEILALMATPNPSLPNLECSVLLGGKPIPWLSQQLQGIQTRRDEIAPTIEGTNEWIWNHPKFASWRDQPGDCLAIVGKPGSGKSVLAKHIVTTLQGHSSFQHTPPNEPAPGTGQAGLLSSWFYSKRSGEQFVKHQVLLQAVLHEFLAQQPELFDVYKETYRAASPSPQRSWTMDELVELLKRLAESPQHVLIVIDAVDEASDDSILQLVESLCQISGSHMKFLVVTRPVRLLERRFWKSRKITVQEENRKDIYEVVLKRCETLRRLMHGIDVDIDVHTETDDSEPDEDDIIMDAYLPNEATGQQQFEQAQNWETFELQQLCDGIIEQSDGVMLWVLLVFDLLNMAVAREGFLSLAEIRERAKRMPSELDEFYTQFIQDLQQRRDKNGLTKVRHALMWISAASEIKPFTLGELWDALAVPSSKEIEANDYQNASYSLIERNRIPAKSWSELRRIIEKLCGPFVEVIQVPDQDGKRSGTAATSIIQLMHQTAREFLMHSENAGSLAFTPEEAAALIQGAASRYVNIALPLSYSTYAPQMMVSYGQQSKTTRSWRLCRASYDSKIFVTRKPSTPPQPPDSPDHNRVLS
ncbi:hypothetical protein GQ53DRAFT_801351 [Thozetella sp. PMI_491]|nr:hypothetical protein GQ53DRAFT_801351 [Thozetella sp. PMI_491]